MRTLNTSFNVSFDEAGTITSSPMHKRGGTHTKRETLSLAQSMASPAFHPVDKRASMKQMPEATALLPIIDQSNSSLFLLT